MKKFLMMLAVLSVAIPLFASTDPNATDNIGLWKPDADDRTAALADANNNWDMIDDLFSGTTQSFFPYFYSVRSSVVSSGDTNESFKIRTGTTANQPTGYVIRGADIQGSVDANGEATNVQGATITAYTRSTALNPASSTMLGLKVECKANTGVSSEILGLDVNMFRQAALEPTTETAVRIRNTNTSGSGIDKAIEVLSDSSGSYDNFGYGIDLSGADIDTADLVLSNGATLTNSTANSVLLTLPDITDVASSGDHMDCGFKLRINNTANQPAGYVLRGADIQASTSDDGENTNIYGATVTAYTKVGAAEPAGAVMYGLKVENKINQAITSESIGEDINMFRQAALEPTTEVGLRIRNNNTSGTGIDSAIQIKSDGGSTETDDFVAGIDMSSANIDQAQLVFSNGAKLFVGSASSENAVYSAVGAYDAVGSIYISSVGKIFVQVANNDANADWETVTSASAE